MADITTDELDAYLDDALPDADSARVERALRDSAELRETLKSVIARRDRGDHSLGAVWRRERVSCPTREQLGGYLLGALDDGWLDYVAFHLDAVGCPFCRANLADLQARQAEAAPHTHERRRRFFASSAGLLKSPTRPGGKG